MSKFDPFTFDESSVRVVTIDGEPWLVGGAVAEGDAFSFRSLMSANPGGVVPVRISDNTDCDAVLAVQRQISSCLDLVNRSIDELGAWYRDSVAEADQSSMNP